VILVDVVDRAAVGDDVAGKLPILRRIPSSRSLPHAASPFTRLYAHMSEYGFASLIVVSKCGRYVSRRSRSLTTASKVWRSGSGPEWTAKCFTVAMVL
jgi:hypothetical protein